MTERDTRDYHSPLREQQALETRHRILRAAADLIVRGGLVGFAMRDVAEEAEVSERTVYNHFPSRQALLDGLADWVDEQLREVDLQADPRDIDDLSGRIPAIMRALEDIGAPAHAMARLAIGQGMESAASRERTSGFRDRFTHLLDPLPDDEAERAFAMLRHLVSSTTWFTLRDRFELSADDTSAAIGWALDTLLADLRRRTEGASG
ncbi:MAG: helix-turn-helix domain-containing protein [Nitriliruptorales bacterium]|nr:helix-turn-helix domain-containing protein [Nitriliruptorales bacterium]